LVLDAMEFISLFAGIGGMDLGLERAGMICVAQVEINPFCRQVLEKHWPDVPRFEDVRDVGKHNLPSADLIAGGFPCQPHSVAGKRKGAADDRNLWPEFSRIIAECRPRFVLAENVFGIVTTYLDTVLSDLEGQGYACATFNLPACAFDAPHRRERIFVVAHAPSDGRQRGQGSDEHKCQYDTVGRGEQPERDGGNGAMADARDIRQYARRPGEPLQGAGLDGKTPVENSQRSGDRAQIVSRQTGRKNPTRPTSRIGRPGWWATEPDVGRVAYGTSARVDRLRLSAIGNAVVPQVAEWIGRRIMTYNLQRRKCYE